MNTTAWGVRGMTVISTGWGALHPEHMVRTHRPALWWVLTSRRWVRVPINVFVIEHVDGLVLFDTGVDPRAAADHGYWPDAAAQWVVQRTFGLDVGPDDGLASRLEVAGFDPHDVTTAVLSHLHFDHVGGIGDIPQASLMVDPEAWDHMVGSPHPERDFIPRSDILRPGAAWRLLRFEPTDDPALAPFTETFDVMGDGSLMVLRTPGHLPGSISLLVRREHGAPVLLIGDLTYCAEFLERDQTAGTGDERTLLSSFAAVRALQAHTPELMIVASHDITAANKFATHPERIGAA